MLGMEQIKAVLPERLTSTFVFYPLILLVASGIGFVLSGLFRGLRRRATDAGEPTWMGLRRTFEPIVAAQVLCVMVLVLSALAYERPHMKPGKIHWEIGLGFAVAFCALFALIGQPIVRILDNACFLLGRASSVAYRLSTTRRFKPGSVVVQTVQRHSRCPEPGAREVRPEAHGDYIDYVVDKFRRVAAVEGDTVTVLTRKGYVLQLDPSDPLLRKPTLIERFKYHSKFPPNKAA